MAFFTYGYEPTGLSVALSSFQLVIRVGLSDQWKNAWLRPPSASTLRGSMKSLGPEELDPGR